MKPRTPDSRLRAAADFVREGATLADVGCDHALLPVWLCRTGRVVRAYACDIAEGPCRAARATVEEARLSDRVEVVRTDGLSGLEGRGVTDVTICGMGGELIASIIDAAPFVRDPALRLILVPMTKPAHLRRYLAENGFVIEAETVTRAAGKLYFCFCVTFDGAVRMLSPFEEEFGTCLPSETPLSPLFCDYLAQKARALCRRIDGLTAGGEEAGREKEILCEIGRYLHDCP